MSARIPHPDRSKRFWCVRLSTPLSALFVAMCGQGPAQADEENFFTEIPVVASISRLPQKLSEAPGAVTVIDQEMIRASGFRTIEDLLRLVPGFQVTSHNQSSAIVAYHGLNSAGVSSAEYGPRVQVLIDGQSQYSPLFKGGVNWNMLPVALENIERIEVTRGSNTTSYGSNAFMGVINIITMDSALTQGWTLSANQGSNHIADQTLRWGGRIGESTARLTYHHLGDNGFQKGLYSNRWVDAPDDRRTDALDFRMDIPLPDPRDELRLNISHVQDNSLYGRPDSPNSDPVRGAQTGAKSIGLKWRRAQSAQEEWSLRYAYAEDELKDTYLNKGHSSFQVAQPWLSLSTLLSQGLSPTTSYLTATYPDYLTTQDGRSQSHELEFEHRQDWLNGWRATWGAQLKTVALSSYGQFSSYAWQHRDSQRLFGNVEYRPHPDWVFNAGASLENDSIHGVMLDPRLSASWHVHPDHTLRAVVSRAHRSASLYENQGYQYLMANVTGTTLQAKNIIYYGQGVEPEQIDTFELGYLGELKPQRASLDVRAFIERIPNRLQFGPLALPASASDDQETWWQRLCILTQLSLSSTACPAGSTMNISWPNGRADGFANMERVFTRGYELQARWQPFDRTRLLYNYTMLTIHVSPYGSALVADDIPNSLRIFTQTSHSAPTRAHTAMLIQELPWSMQGSLMYFRTGTMFWRRNPAQPNAESERLDWRLAKSFTWAPGKKGELAYTVQMANGNQEGRAFFRLAERLQWLSLRMDF